MASVGAVLDACVLIPSGPRDILLRCAAVGLYRPHWSDEILVETERNLVSHGMAIAERAERTIWLMRQHFPEALVSGALYEQAQAIATNHPKDQHVLGAAIAANAEIIVTENLRDFPRDVLAPFGIEAMTTDSFLCDLADLDPTLMVKVVHSRAMALKRPPETVDEMLASLVRQLPRFIACMQDIIQSRASAEIA